VAGVRQAAPDPLCVNLAFALWPYAHLRGLVRDGREILQLALGAATAAGDRWRAALVSVHLGWFEAKSTSTRPRKPHLRAALEIFTNIGYEPGIAEALVGVAYLQGYFGQYDASRRSARRALRASPSGSEPAVRPGWRCGCWLPVTATSGGTTGPSTSPNGRCGSSPSWAIVARTRAPR
jgi:hypothetical protein